MPPRAAARNNKASGCSHYKSHFHADTMTDTIDQSAKGDRLTKFADWSIVSDIYEGCHSLGVCMKVRFVMATTRGFVIYRSFAARRKPLCGVQTSYYRV